MSVPDILPCIEQPVVTLTFPEIVMQKIPGQWTEDNSETDGKIIYDIRFTLRYRGIPSKIHLNLEAQRSISFAKLKYHIENRITYYVSRMISAQKNTEFFIQIMIISNRYTVSGSVWIRPKLRTL